MHFIFGRVYLRPFTRWTIDTYPLLLRALKKNETCFKWLCHSRAAVRKWARLHLRLRQRTSLTGLHTEHNMNSDGFYNYGTSDRTKQRDGFVHLAALRIATSLVGTRSFFESHSHELSRTFNDFYASCTCFDGFP